VGDRDPPYREANNCHLRWEREIHLMGEQTAVTIVREEIYVIGEQLAVIMVREEIYVIGKQTAAIIVKKEIYIIGKQTAVYRQLLLRSLPYQN
jgi:hypothetical protein